MSWAFIVVRNNIVEQVKVFDDFWVGADYTDNFIEKIDPGFAKGGTGLPSYNRNEYYKKDDLSVGLYRNTN